MSEFAFIVGVVKLCETHKITPVWPQNTTKSSHFEYADAPVFSLNVQKQQFGSFLLLFPCFLHSRQRFLIVAEELKKTTSKQLNKKVILPDFTVSNTHLNLRESPGARKFMVLLLEQRRGRQFELEVIRSRLAADQKSRLLVTVGEFCQDGQLPGGNGNITTNTPAFPALFSSDSWRYSR